MPAEGRPAGLLSCNLRFRRLDGYPHPFVLHRVELPNDPGGVSNDYGVRREALSDKCVRAHDAMTTQHQLAPRTHNCGSLAEPRTLADTNSASLRNTPFTDWRCAPLRGADMVHYPHRLCGHNIPLKVDIVLGGYQTPGIYAGAVIDHDNGFPILLRRCNDIDNGILPDLDRITKLDSARIGPTQTTGIMD